ncbi:hypothetical protein HHK36_033382 [Tetracentron sinense]|uniref:Uncharacterized protein n=1 Tax=Tetracentron sinense TaxID=13715 RepID=A0A834Y6K8_TETSI|nr:hypothetical protein HHK36_033382 [Tetracentron sinense]
MDGGSDAAESALSCARCGKPAHLQCPKCVELKLPREGAAFCFVLRLVFLHEEWSELRRSEMKTPITKAGVSWRKSSTQDCFKASWSSHKSVHLKEKSSTLREGTADEQISSLLDEGWLYCLKKGQTRTSKLPHFDWTGKLRPYPISSHRIVPAHIDKPDWAIDGIPKIEPSSELQNIVEIKTPEKIERMRETCRVSIAKDF